MAELSAVLRLELAGEPVPGQWCGPCALPSAVEVVALVGIGTGSEPPVLTPTTIRLCTDCGDGEVA